MLQLRTFAFVWWCLHISRCQCKVQETTEESVPGCSAGTQSPESTQTWKWLSLLLGYSIFETIFETTLLYQTVNRYLKSVSQFYNVSLMKSLWLVFQKMIAAEYAAFERLSVEVFCPHVLGLFMESTSNCWSWPAKQHSMIFW